LKRNGGIVWKIFNGQIYVVGIISSRTDSLPFVAQRISAVSFSLSNIFSRCYRRLDANP
jgi:hypothetical protein